MKMFKSSIIIGFVFLIGMMVSPAMAEFQSLFGKQIEGSEFIKMKAYPNSYGPADTFVVIHKDEVISLSADPTANINLKYNITLSNGMKYSLTKENFELALTKLDWEEMKA